MYRVPLVLLALALSTASGVDMSGRFGMGVGWNLRQSRWGPSYAETKIGLGKRVILEPTLDVGYTSRATEDGEGTEDSYSIQLTALFAYAVLASEKTNVYAKAGAGFESGKGYESSFHVTGLLVPLGIGLEHFVSRHFSVDLNAQMGLSVGTYPSVSVSANVTNGVVGAGLVWYY